MAALIMAFALLLHLTAGHTSVIVHDTSFLERRVGTQVTISLGYVVCWPGGRSEVHLPRTAPFTTYLHELAHAYDCLDDGEMNGSPLPPSSSFVGEHRQCTLNQVQRYACYVEEVGDVGVVR